MANSEQTKRALADGLKLALNSQEFDRITVGNLDGTRGDHPVSLNTT